MVDMLFQPGTVLAQKYKLGSVLGVGGMGTVYEAEHLALKAPVAIKVIDREVGEGDVALARFMREAQAAAALRSPHVVQILDYGMEGKRPFMVMEMLEGEALSDRIKRDGRLSPQETFRVVSHVARAISKAHEADIVHRDLKPDNIFLVHNEGDEIAKVLDFGVAKVDATALGGEGHTRTGSLLGTPYYMSPEQAQGNKDIDARSDLWAVGVIAFECLTGIRPFSSDGLGDLVLQICIRDIPKPSDFGHVPEGFDAWFEKACQREPQDRFQSARELAEALKESLDMGPEGIPESRWTQAVLPSRRQQDDLEAKTTQPDSDPATSPRPPSAASTLPGHSGSNGDLDSTGASEDPGVARGGVDTDSEQGEQRQGSQWEVLPHGHGRELPQKSPSQMMLQDDDERPSSAGTVAFVAISALLVGGAIAFGISQAGIDLSDKPTASPKARDLRQKSDQKLSRKSAPSTAPPATTTAIKADRGKNPQEAKGTTKSGAPADETMTEETLKAIEDAAKEAIKVREGGEDEKPSTAQGSEQTTPDQEKDPKDKKDKKVEAEETPDGENSRPEPRLPDNLTPAPEPPLSPGPAKKPSP